MYHKDEDFRVGEGGGGGVGGKTKGFIKTKSLGWARERTRGEYRLMKLMK